MSKKVFISYSHKDQALAKALKEKLCANGIDVIIDMESMMPGADIKDFILDSVRNSDITLSIVSRDSLLSAWVAMETINTFNREAIDSTKKFIPCYIDSGFLNRSFTDNASDIIENIISEINETIKKRIDKNRGIRDLQNEWQRYRALLHDLDEIVRRLRESRCIDITGKKSEANLTTIIQAIKSDLFND